MSLMEIEKSAPHGTVRTTGYLRWSGFSESANELVLAQLTHTMIIDEAAKTLDHHVKERVGTLTVTIVDRLKEDGAYPYRTRSQTRSSGPNRRCSTSSPSPPGRPSAPATSSREQ